MVFFSLLLGSIMSILINSAKFSTDVRKALRDQNYVTNQYWMGICLIVGAVVTVLGLVATYTAWGLLSAISDNNSHALLRSSMGQYVTSLPSKFVVASLYLYLTSLILFLVEIVSGPAMYCLIALVTGLFFQVVVSLSAFGRLIIHTGAMGKKRVLDPQFERYLLPSGLHASLLIKATERRRRRTSVTSQYQSSNNTNNNASGGGGKHNSYHDHNPLDKQHSASFSGENNTTGGSHRSSDRKTNSVRRGSKSQRRRGLSNQGSRGLSASSNTGSVTSLSSTTQSQMFSMSQSSEQPQQAQPPLSLRVDTSHPSPLVIQNYGSTQQDRPQRDASQATPPPTVVATTADVVGTAPPQTDLDNDDNLLSVDENETILLTARAFSPDGMQQPSPSSLSRSQKRHKSSHSRKSSSRSSISKNEIFFEEYDHEKEDDESVDDLVNDIRFPRPSVLNRTTSNELYDVVQMTLSQSEQSHNSSGDEQEDEYCTPSCSMLSLLEEGEEEDDDDVDEEDNGDGSRGEHKTEHVPLVSRSVAVESLAVATASLPVSENAQEPMAALLRKSRTDRVEKLANLKRLQRQSVVAVYRRSSHNPETAGVTRKTPTKTSPLKKQQIREEWQAEEDVRDMYGVEPPVDFLDEIESDIDEEEDSHDDTYRDGTTVNDDPTLQTLPTATRTDRDHIGGWLRRMRSRANNLLRQHLQLQPILEPDSSMKDKDGDHNENIILISSQKNRHGAITEETANPDNHEKENSHNSSSDSGRRRSALLLSSLVEENTALSSTKATNAFSQGDDRSDQPQDDKLIDL